MTSSPPEARFTAACVQLCSSRDYARNVHEAEELIREAARQGADYVQTPEQTSLMELDRDALFSDIRPQEEDAALAAFQRLAKELGVWLHIGSLAIRISKDRAANRAFLIGPSGVIAAAYDKIHMFDVDLPGGESYRESRTYEPGRHAVFADLPWARIGLTICYDLRFPQLYRMLAQGGATILSAPAAFTRRTGEAHWHILQRARAIENGAFVISAAQGGTHENGRETFGHSMIVSPWGEILAEAGTEPGVIMAEVDIGQVDVARGRIASLTHDRPFAEPAALPERRAS
jgi:deaminated glutathione amidase